MSDGSTAEIIAIGDELLSGETVDTNSSWLDGQLEKWGYAVRRHVTVADELEAIRDAFREAATRSDLVLSTGGLGPTRDDLTLEALALALNTQLELHQPTLDAIEAKFKKFGREMTPNNRRQAMVPAIGEALANASGTAPGFFAELSGAKIFCMPGVPREVRHLMEAQVRPRVEDGKIQRLRRTLQVLGLGESRLEHSIRDIVKAHQGVQFGFRTRGVDNHIKLVAEGEGAQQRLHDAEIALTELLGERLYGFDDADLFELVSGLLIERKQTVAVAESCTGGLVMRRFTEKSGASACFLGGIVVYADAVKVQQVGVDPELIKRDGAVSEGVVRQLAEGVRTRLGADWGLATTGIAGPTGAREGKPVGTVWLGVSDGQQTDAWRVVLPGDRSMVQDASAKIVVDGLRRRLLAAS